MVEEIVFPNGQTRHFDYDQQGRIVELATAHPATGTIARFNYGYYFDPVTSEPTRLGLRTTVTTSLPALGIAGATTNLLYDEADQLTGADYPAGASVPATQHRWTYDAIANRTSVSVDGTTLPYLYQTVGAGAGHWHRLLAAGGTSYTYDFNDNVTSTSGQNGASLTWDFEDRLISVVGSQSSSYGYDYQGRRVATNGAGGSRHVPLRRPQRRCRDWIDGDNLVSPRRRYR